MRVLLLFGGLLLGALVPYQGPQRFEFEVVTIKPHGPDVDAVIIGGACRNVDSPPARGPLNIGTGRCVLKKMTLKMLINRAYSLGAANGAVNQVILGGPAWTGTDEFDIEAKAEDPKTTQDEFLLMFQALISDRFKLKFHRETRELPALALLIGKNGIKLTESSGELQGMRESRRAGVVTATSQKMDMKTVARFLSGRLGVPVIDKTSLTGTYDFTLTWTADEAAPADTTAPTLLTALQEQLGLRLESQKIPAEVFVIDAVEKPLP